MGNAISLVIAMTNEQCLMSLCNQGQWWWQASGSSWNGSLLPLPCDKVFFFWSSPKIWNVTVHKLHLLNIPQNVETEVAFHEVAQKTELQSSSPLQVNDDHDQGFKNSIWWIFPQKIKKIDGIYTRKACFSQIFWAEKMTNSLWEKNSLLMMDDKNHFCHLILMLFFDPV